jgi:hypothetical protein
MACHRDRQCWPYFLDCQHQALAVDEEVTFATVDLFAAFLATLAINASGFDRLAIKIAALGCRLRASA